MTNPIDPAHKAPEVFHVALTPAVGCICGGYPRDRTVMLSLRGAGADPLTASCELTVGGARALVDVLQRCIELAEAETLQ